MGTVRALKPRASTEEQGQSPNWALCLKADNVGINAQCRLCGVMVYVGEVGLYVEGTWEPICDSCGHREAPELVMLKEIYQRFGCFLAERDHARKVVLDGLDLIDF